MLKRKNIMLFMICGILLLFGSGIVSYAENNGWVHEDNTWRYYSNGKLVKSQWVQSGDLWYYLNSNGDMASNGWISSIYYVGADGVRLVNQWRKLPPESGAGEYWFYFGSDGTRTANSWQTINDNRYYFDNRGRMHTGWFNDEYYFGNGDDGAMKTGWIKVLPSYSQDKGVADTEENRQWFYFQNNGKLYQPELKSGYSAITKTIDNATYAFNSDGMMLHGWVNVSDSGSSTSIKDYKYFGGKDDGKLKSDGWYYVVAPDKIKKETNDSEPNWFYLGSKGVPKNSTKTNSFSKSDLTTIDGISYVFDKYGRAQYGLTWIGDELYYLGTKNQCSMQMGYFENLEESRNKTGTFYFNETGTNAGRGYTGDYNGYLFYKGKLQTASTSQRFLVVCVSNKDYVINTSGMIQKNATIVAGDGTVYRTNNSGVLTHIYSESVSGGGNGTEPKEAGVNK